MPRVKTVKKLTNGSEATRTSPASTFTGTTGTCETTGDALTNRIVSSFDQIIREPRMEVAKRCLRDVIKRCGLGVGLLVLHRRGLATGHIPRSTPAEPVKRLDSHADRFVYVHVPVRAIRRNRAALVAQGIMNDSPDPNHLIYHEDGLVGTFSFRLAQIKDLYPALKPQDVVSDLLTCLEAQDLLEHAELDSWQVQFKDLKAAEKIRKDLITYYPQRVFVRTNKGFDHSTIWLPAGYDRPEIRAILKTALEYKAPCNYCGVRELNPLEDIASTSLVPDWEDRYGFSMSRSYEFGFTFAPFGEPDTVCHFLAWDNPSISEVVLNMDLQVYSFGDLVRLTCAINKDIKAYCDEAKIPFTPFVGVCNHWAGNSIYHQHYQFFRIPNLPLTRATVDKDVLVHHDAGLKVQRLAWPTPVYRIVMNDPVRVDALSDLADAMAVLWNELSKPEERIEIGNEIVINNHTQNTIVTQNGAAAEAYFIPRLRSKLDAMSRMGVKKTNLAVLEVLGYLLIDDAKDWAVIDKLNPEERNRFGEGALGDVAPDDSKIREFEDELQVRLGDEVRHIIEDLRDLAEPARLGDIERRIRRLLSHVQGIITNTRMSRDAKSEVLNHASDGFRMLTAQRNKLERRPNKQGEILFTRETIKHLIDQASGPPALANYP